MDINLDILNTEQQNPNTMDIDTYDTIGILEQINKEDKTVAQTIQEVLPAITRLVDSAYERLKMGGRIIYIGAGTSGRLGILDASECPPTYGVSPQLVQGLIAGGEKAIFKAQEGAEDDAVLARSDLQAIALCSQDIVIGLAASGRTPYVIGGLQYAQEIGAASGSICCVEQGEISNYAQCPVEAVTGAEVVTGSTRMKAGTAQKMILNMVSTACMIKMGKVYHNLMIDVRPSNAKLEVRARRIIAKALHCSDEEAQRLFTNSQRDVKVAIVMGASGLRREEVIALLKTYDGHITKTLQALEK